MFILIGIYTMLKTTFTTLAIWYWFCYICFSCCFWITFFINVIFMFLQGGASQLDMYDMNWRNMAPVCYAMGPWYLEVMWYAVKAMAMRLRYATAPSPSTTSFARHLNRALAPPPHRQDQERPRPSHSTIDDVEGGG